MAKVWLFQDSRQRKDQGTKAAWHVAWYEGRKKRSKKVGTKKAAREYQSRLESAMNSDEFSGAVRSTWQEVRSEYMTAVMATRREGTRVQARIALDHLERILAPTTLADITRQTLTEFAAARSKEKNRSGNRLSRATINKDLRQIRAFLHEAVRRKYLFKCPEIPFLKESKRIPTYITPEVFGKLYAACEVATEPSEQGYSAPDWWRAYLVFLYLTGWRAMEPLALGKDDIDWEDHRAFLRAEANKGDRDEVVPLHPMVIDHLSRVKSFGSELLPWPLSRRKLWGIFHQIQDAAGVKRRDGKHYGFHDLRRGFATMNADRMSADALQTIMRHRDYGTTQRYINLARQLNPAVRDIFVPDLPTGKAGSA